MKSSFFIEETGEIPVFSACRQEDISHHGNDNQASGDLATYILVNKKTRRVCIAPVLL
jgi:hypothetical protein